MTTVFIFGDSHFLDLDDKLRDLETGDVLDAKDPQLDKRIKLAKQRIIDDRAAFDKVWGAAKGNTLRFAGGYFTGPDGTLYDRDGKPHTNAKAFANAQDKEKKTEALIRSICGKDVDIVYLNAANPHWDMV